MKKIFFLAMVLITMAGTAAPVDSTHIDTITTVASIHTVDPHGIAFGITALANAIPQLANLFYLFLLIASSVGIPLLMAVQTMLKKDPHSDKLRGVLGIIADVLTALVKDVPVNKENITGEAKKN